MEILKDLLFKLHLTTMKRGKPEEFLTEFNAILDKLNEKTLKPFLKNSLLQNSFEKPVLDLLKTVFLFKVKNDQLNFYQNGNKLIDIYLEKALKGFKNEPNHINRLVTLINISLNRLIVCNDEQSRLSFEKIREFTVKNIATFPFEALVSLNINLQENGLYTTYGIEPSMETIQNLVSKGNFEKLGLALVRLNRSGLNPVLCEYIKKIFLKKEIQEKLDPKSISLLITTNFMHRQLFTQDFIENLYKNLKRHRKNIGFLEISMIVTSLNKGRMLNNEKIKFLGEELENFLFTSVKTSNKYINDINYHSCVTLLGVFSQNINENNIKPSLFKDLNYILNSHTLKGISKPEILTIFQSNATFLRKSRKMNFASKETIRVLNECSIIIGKVFLKFLQNPLILNRTIENFDILLSFFQGLVQIDDVEFKSTIDSLALFMKENLPKLNNKQVLSFFNSILELLSLVNKSEFERQILPSLSQSIEARVLETIVSFFQDYQDALSLLVIVSTHRETLRAKTLFNKIEREFIENMGKFTALENSYLIFPLVKFALFDEKEIDKIEEFYRKSLFCNQEIGNFENLEALLYNILMNFTQENQFSPLFFEEIESFLEKRVLSGDLSEKVSLEGKLKVFSILGRFEIKNQSLLASFWRFVLRNREKLKVFEWMNILNVLLINQWGNIDDFKEILGEIEKSIGEIGENDEFFSHHVTLAKLLEGTLRSLYSEEIALDKFTKFQEFASRNQIDPESKRKSSLFQNTIKSVLSEIKVNFEEEKRIGPFVVDFFILPDVCFEINGRNHFIAGKRYNRNTQRKYLVLQNLGYQVRALSPELWNTFEKEENRGEILKQVIFSPDGPKRKI